MYRPKIPKKGTHNNNNYIVPVEKNNGKIQILSITPEVNRSIANDIRVIGYCNQEYTLYECTGFSICKEITV